MVLKSYENKPNNTVYKNKQKSHREEKNKFWIVLIFPSKVNKRRVSRGSGTKCTLSLILWNKKLGGEVR